MAVAVETLGPTGAPKVNKDSDFLAASRPELGACAPINLKLSSAFLAASGTTTGSTFLTGSTVDPKENPDNSDSFLDGSKAEPNLNPFVVVVDVALSSFFSVTAGVGFTSLNSGALSTAFSSSFAAESKGASSLLTAEAVMPNLNTLAASAVGLTESPNLNPSTCVSFLLFPSA